MNIIDLTIRHTKRVCLPIDKYVILFHLLFPFDSGVLQCVQIVFHQVQTETDSTSSRVIIPRHFFDVEIEYFLIGFRQVFPHRFGIVVVEFPLVVGKEPQRSVGFLHFFVDISKPANKKDDYIYNNA